ncbi:unnamed protein product [Rotaria sordida]|uniref:Uncharacterized protein n=1 Tax=Rotaria sordida TaxID=392033 RepID=A0A814FJI5_9BILA|nr:unnamed protein product [Rotaria sordida]
MANQAKSSSYEIVPFGLDHITDQRLHNLFRDLMHLDPMDKNGPMSGSCGHQTDQMEKFLSQTFGFRNIPGEYIVQGVRSFKLDNSVSSLKPETEIRFPSNTTNSFAMSVQEIMNWQRSYRVYADNNIRGMNKEFLKRALQGKSEDGEEAFRMKFVVRISTCPILMEFDAKIIRRNLNDNWPNRIKLVSVTGIDFAGRKHDVGDILYYVSNWREVFQIDPQSRLPLVYNGRDFYVNVNEPRGKLHKERVQDSLMRMVRLRLQACDAEGVQIVVETGIGLGVFAGNHIGIDAKVRALSAKAILTVLERDASLYKNIRAVILALPRFNRSKSNHPVADTFDAFVNEFHKAKYNGPIPVLIADQDMHRLTVAIARQGFIVSELNPADSHGVFGEYWQNRGPAVEEKLALTTVGLLVQHHLINTEVLNENNYRLLTINEGSTLDWLASVSNDNERMTTNCCSHQ